MKANSKGYNLVEISDDIWSISAIEGENFIGTFSEVVIFSVLNFGLKLDEIEQSVKSMYRLNHNAAHFGMWNTFIFSYTHKFEVERRAS